MFFIPEHYRGTVDHILITHGTIQDRIEKLAYDIARDYKDLTIHLMCVLKGGSAFFQDLCNAIRKFHDYSRGTQIPFTFDFIRVKSYEGTQSSGEVTISGVSMEKLKGKHILFVEDLIDTGLTMKKVFEKITAEASPATIRVASLLEKRTERALAIGFKGDYVGFSIPDKFIIGYNMDFNEAYRDMMHIGVINEEGIQKYKDFDV